MNSLDMRTTSPLAPFRIRFYLFHSVLVACFAMELKPTCVYINHLEGYLKDTGPKAQNKCLVSPICNKTFTIAYIDMMPYTTPGIDYMLELCCGSCVRNNLIKRILRNITELDRNILKSSDFVYPILASTTVKRLYGANFLPFVETPSIMYITKKTEIDLLGNIFSVYPVVIVCLMMASVSGFIGWLIETWRNDREFPRPFLIGWFEGFWWSFVSMTTVGYGDKCPRSITGRLFSVIWIIIGIVSFAVLTGELTGQIVKANEQQPESMDGQRVGVLRYRDYDAYMVSEYNGIVVRDQTATNFDDNLFNLISDLRNDNIGGFVLDKWTLYYVTVLFQNTVFSDKNKRNLVHFFLKETTRVEHYSPSDKLSFGMLVKDKGDAEYFMEFTEDAHLRSKMVYGEFWINAKMETLDEDAFYNPGSAMLFDVSGPIFKKTITYISAILVFIICFGLCYELKTKACINHKNKSPINGSF